MVKLSRILPALGYSYPEEIMRALVPYSVSIAGIPLCRTQHRVSAFHSTPIGLAKWKSKWDCKAQKSGPKPSKTYMRYVVRQKRAEMKKALKDYLLYGKTSKLQSQDENRNWYADDKSFRMENNGYNYDATSTSRNCGRSKFQSSSSSRKHNRGNNKTWQNRSFHNEYCHEHPEIIYADFVNRFKGFTWSYDAWVNYHFSEYGKQSEWKENSKSEKAKSRVWSDMDDEDESCDVGSHTHRVTLGLPPTGPLKLDDVKSAFRVSAMKWHPDKHQGPSQAIAAEKFKVCVDAYNSLCSILKAT